MTIQRSLIEPSSAQPIATALGWIESVLLGEVAVILCVLAVAFIGALMLTGRLPLRRGMMVIVGCFVLLGAPMIAAGIVNASL